MPRARDLGIRIGTLPTGPTNSVLDVDGVGLGHATVHRDEPLVARTGVSCLVLAEDAYLRPVPAGGAVLNGAGECTGFITAQEWASAETPVYLTSTMQLGRVYDAACEIALEAHAEVADDVIIPIVGECDDSHLNDCRRMHVTADDVRAAHAAALASRGASAPPAEGAVGSGTGMSCLGFKGGIGTSSRVTAEGHTVAVLLMTNFGARSELTVAGVPVGRLLPPPPSEPGRSRPAPASASWSPTLRSTAPRALGWRAGSGSAWPAPGSVAHHGSGEIFMAFGTGMRLDRDQQADVVPLSGRGDRPALPGGRRGDRGSGAQLDVHSPHHGRPRRQLQRVRALPRGPRTPRAGAPA